MTESNQPHATSDPAVPPVPPQTGTDAWGQPATSQPSQPPYGQQPTPGQPDAYQPAAQGWNQPGWSQPADQQQAWAPPVAQYGQQPWGQPPIGYAQPRKKTGMSIAALVLGIVGLVASPFPFGSYVAILLAILAVIFGIIGVRRRVNKGMAIAGIVLGAVALIIAVIMSIFWTNVFRIAADCLEQYPSGQGTQFNQCIQDGARDITN